MFLRCLIPDSINTILNHLSLNQNKMVHARENVIPEWVAILRNEKKNFYWESINNCSWYVIVYIDWG